MIVKLNVLEVECTFSPWGHSKMYTPGTIANSQTESVPTKIRKVVLLSIPEKLKYWVGVQRGLS